MTDVSMYRHVRNNCKIAGSNDGMETLIDHTLQRQLKDQIKTTEELQQRLAEATSLMEKMSIQIAEPKACQVTNNNIIHNTAIQINILPWDGKNCIGVNASHIIAAFEGNEILQKYIKLSDLELADPKVAPPYVAELFIDLTRRAHADPASRNIYLSPRRSDQVLVHKASGEWEVLPLLQALQELFNGVARKVLDVSRSYEERRELPAEAQNALAIAGMLYDNEPEEYVRRAKGPMVAHLENCRPQQP
jgi:hypothetical protein